jgi:hypothetical protein
VVRVGGLRAVALSLSLLLLAVAQAHAQAPPPPPTVPPPSQAPPAEIGFVSPYEIMKTVRSAGFSPLAPPLREGTTYVLRAIDFRGILMRVVVDARTGAIRDANRIVPGPGRFGQMGSMVPPSDDPDFDAPAMGPTATMEQPLRPPGARSATSPTVSVPLPRPRPGALAVRKSTDDANAGSSARPRSDPKSEMNRGGSAGAQGHAESGDKPGAQINSEVIPTAPPPTPVAPKETPAVIPPLND